MFVSGRIRPGFAAICYQYVGLINHTLYAQKNLLAIFTQWHRPLHLEPTSELADTPMHSQPHISTTSPF
jgi:hypothetical protein